MTDFRGRPEFLPLVAAVRAGDAAAVAALWDLLEDCQATTADVMTLYARPPVWQYQIAEGVTIIEAAAEDDSLRPVLAAWADRHGPAGRGADVRAWCCEQTHRAGRGGDIDIWTVGKLRFADGLLIGSSTNSEPAARRELKRRVLGLFAEIRVPCPRCKGTGQELTMTRTPIQCGGCFGKKTAAPADLIPPEDWGPPTSTPADDLRALRDTLLGLPVVLPDVGPVEPITAASLRCRAMTRGVRR